MSDEVDIIPEQLINDDPNENYFPRVLEPIVIRGTGHITVFALNNKFDEEYPQGLAHRVSRDEYQETIRRVNMILKKNVPNHFKWLLCGCICCCCTFGLSLCPVVCLNKRSKHAVSKILDAENLRIYHKIGLHWCLTRQKCSNNAVQEYVLMIEFRPPLSLTQPD